MKIKNQSRRAVLALWLVVCLQEAVAAVEIKQPPPDNTSAITSQDSPASSQAPSQAPRPPVIVEYIQPEKFTDIASSQYGPPNSSYLDQLSKHIAKQALSYLNAGQSLTISILDIDMAGAFEPWNTPGQDIRMIKHIYPPRIALRYQLRDAEGKVLKDGEAHLSNPNYLMNLSPNSMDSVRHEKALMDDWLRRSFSPPQ
ncbi:DUF3016 domain-containing protein [Methylobacillus glycogenes]|uniref:DUF3016 domain-containing protein n=1 Tax=Methylobacillus glycogenes TaxID=406 RepID=UPI000471966D|nr:DUF3016 domain-containing protein [Methylobacillus glycogenes]